MRALVVGLGSMGRRHLENLRVLAPEADIAVLRRMGSSDCESTLRIVKTLDEAVAWQPDIALLANPAPWHISDGRALAEAGAHLFIEKPLSDRREGVEELVALCAEKGRVLMVAYPLRFSASLRALKGALNEGRIGRVMGCRAEVGQYLPEWRPGQQLVTSVSARAELGGGAALELSHELDYLRWLFGEVREVSGWMGTRGELGLEVEDWVEALLQFESGVVASVHLDMVQRSPQRACRIMGTEGTLTWDGLSQEVRCFQQGWTVLHSEPQPDRNAMYREELAHFLRCVDVGETPKADGSEGWRTLEVVLAVKAAAREGRRLEVARHG